MIGTKLNKTEQRKDSKEASKKDQLRSFIKQQRSQPIAEDSQRALTQQLVAGLMPLLAVQQPCLWGAYQAVRGEADPKSAIEQLTQKFSELCWAFPRVAGSDIEFFVPKTWVKGPFGINEPDPSTSEKIKTQDLDGVLLPGVMFDRQGGRLGSGKAFYDRALCEYSGHKIGVAFSYQLSDELLPLESHDVSVDYVATENEFLAVKGSAL